MSEQLAVSGQKRFAYDNGLPFDSTLHKNILVLKRRILEENKAALLVIDGGVGEGKTTLGCEVAEDYQESPLVYKDQLGYGGIDFLAKLKTAYKSDIRVVLYDEAGDFDKRGAISRFNMMLNRIFDIYRAFKILVVCMLPSFGVLDTYIIDKKIPRLLLHCENRGGNYGNYKAYSLYRMNYLKWWMNKLVVKDKAYGIVQPNFQGHFLPLPGYRERELERYSTGGKLGILEETEIKHKGLLSLDEVSKRIGRSYVWTQRTVRALNIKEVKIWRNKKYFDPYIVERLMEVIIKGGSS